jgi:hypothetical protein
MDITKTEDKARTFAMRLVPIDGGLAKWAHDLAINGYTVDEIKKMLALAMEDSGRS